MQCHFCSNQATAQCRRCGKLYCDEHGDEVLCDSCLDPASAVPSAAVYRGSLLALLLGTAFAVWLLVRPPDTEPGPEVPVVLNPTVVATGEATIPEGTAVVTETTAPADTETPAGTLTETTEPEDTEEPETPTPTRRPRRTPTPEPGEPVEYVVQEGDTLSDIATEFDVTVEEIQQLNNLTSADLAIGQVLLIPAPEEEPEETPTANRSGASLSSLHLA